MVTKQDATFYILILIMLSPATCAVFLGVLFAVFTIKRRRRRAKLPPGPPRLPLIGNLHQSSKEAMWLPFQKWVDQYGPLVSLDMGGTTLIIIGDYETARDLLDKRGKIYSDRPRMVSRHEIDVFTELHC
jgi:hypothetical protein